MMSLEGSARVVIRHLDIQLVNTQSYAHKRYAGCLVSHGKILVNSALLFYSFMFLCIKYLSMPTKYRLS